MILIHFFLVKRKLCKYWLHYGAASIETFLKGAFSTESVGTAGISDFIGNLKHTQEL